MKSNAAQCAAEHCSMDPSPAVRVRGSRGLLFAAGCALPPRMRRGEQDVNAVVAHTGVLARGGPRDKGSGWV